MKPIRQPFTAHKNLLHLTEKIRNDKKSSKLDKLAYKVLKKIIIDDYAQVKTITKNNIKNRRDCYKAL